MSGERRGAHPVGRGSAGVHAGSAVRLPVAGLLRTRAVRWSESTADWRAGSGSSDRASAGWRRCGLRVTMAMTIMLAMALGRIRAGQPEHLRSLVKPLTGNTLPVTRETQIPPTAPRDRSALSGPAAPPMSPHALGGNPGPPILTASARGDRQRGRLRPVRIAACARRSESEPFAA